MNKVGPLAAGRLRLQAARHKIDAKQFRSALNEIDSAARAGMALRREALLLRGRALFGLENFQGALTAFTALSLLGRKQSRLDGLRGLALVELGRLPEARRALLSGLRGFPRWARVHEALGLIGEIEERAEAVRHFRQARLIDPARFPAVTRLSADDFEAALRAALKEATPHVLAFAAHLPIVVALLPRAQDFARPHPQLRPGALGRLAWAALERDVPTQVLMLYRRNIERAAARKRIGVAEQLKQFCEQILTRPLPPEQRLTSVRSLPHPARP